MADDLGQPAAGLDLCEIAVEGGPQVASRRHRVAVGIGAGQLERDLEVRIEVQQPPGGGLVEDREVGGPVVERVIVPARELDIAELARPQLLDTLLEARAAHRRGGLAGQLGRRAQRAVVARHHHRMHDEIGLREIDRGAPLPGDAERAGDHVALAGQQLRHQRGEGRLDRQHFERHSEALRKALHHLVVDAFEMIQIDFRLDANERILLVREAEHHQLAARLDLRQRARRRRRGSGKQGYADQPENPGSAHPCRTSRVLPGYHKNA
jgi:hypothetical protein